MFISLFRTLILYVLIVAAIRLMGKRQVGELEPAELVAAILISDLASVPMQDIGIPLLSGMIPIVTILALELFTAELSLRSVRFRRVFCGSPVLVISGGKIDQNAMRKNRLSLDELDQCLREKGILDPAQVQYAILETNGTLSTFLYPDHAPLTAGDAGIHPENPELPVTVVSDGRVMSVHLEALGLDMDWLRGQLERRGLSSGDVFLMTATGSGQVHLIKKEAVP